MGIDVRSAFCLARPLSVSARGSQIHRYMYIDVCYLMHIYINCCLYIAFCLLFVHSKYTNSLPDFFIEMKKLFSCFTILNSRNASFNVSRVSRFVGFRFIIIFTLYSLL